MPIRRSRLAAAENAVRWVAGLPAMRPSRSTPTVVTLEPATERDTAMPIQAYKSVRLNPAVEHDVAMPIRPATTHRISAVYSMSWESLGSVEPRVSVPWESSSSDASGHETAGARASAELKALIRDQPIGVQRMTEAAWLLAAADGGKTVAEMLTSSRDLIRVGTIAGVMWGVRRWNLWMRRD